MAKVFEIWDKKSSINGIDAKTVLASRPWAQVNDVILIKEGNRVINIENVEIIRSVLGYTTDKTTSEVAEGLLKYLDDQEKAQQEEQTTLKDMQQQLDDMSLALADILGNS